MKNPHLERAQLLLSQGRTEMAEKELHQALAADPNNAMPHALLAACLCDQKKFQAATDAAGQAIHLAPDMPYVHYIMGHVMYHRNHFAEAREAAGAAIAMDPYDADYFALLAAIELEQKHWKEALKAAELGLEAEPDHVRCTNLRAMALTNLGRREEAGQSIDAALQHDPDNAYTHANQGWNLIAQGRPKDALGHFREALRLEPNMEWARAGIVEAMKARNFVYRWLLHFFLFMARLDPKYQMLLIVGIVFGHKLIVNALVGTPLEPLVPFLIFGYLGFVWLTWCGPTLFNLLLRFDSFGRLVLSDKERMQANIVAVYLLTGIGLVVTFCALGVPSASLLAAPFALALIPLNGVFATSNKFGFWIMVAVTALATVKAVQAVFYSFTDQPELMSDAFWFSFKVCVYSTWASLFLIGGGRPKKV